MKTLRMSTAVLMVLLGMGGWAFGAIQTNNLVGAWDLVFGAYNGQEIVGLEGSLVVTDSMTYQAEFLDDVDSGYVESRFTLDVNDCFQAEADDEYVVKNGENFKLFCCPVRRVWKTFLYCSDETYKQWGATALGFGGPDVQFEGNTLWLVSNDGLTQLAYERTLEPTYGVHQISIAQGVYYDVAGEPTYEMRVDIQTNAQVTLIDCNSPGTASWLMERGWSYDDGVEISYQYNALDGSYHWNYLATYSQESDLDRYRDPHNSTYLFTIYRADGSIETTSVPFTETDGNDLEAITQMPSLLYPAPEANEVPVEVTFAFEPPARESWQTQLAWDQWQTDLLPATESSYGPVTLDPNALVELDITIVNQVVRYNDDLISTEVTQASTATYHFTTEPVFTIPDEALSDGIKAALGVEEVTVEDMKLLRSLDLPNKGIVDLTGLEEAENLESLLLAGNAIVDLGPLSELKNLMYLDLHDNRIVDLTALQGLESLVELSLKNNQIQSLEPLSGLSTLKRINLATNAIVEITALQELILLEALWLNENYIVDLSALTSLEKLMVLNVCDNELDSEDCMDLGKLQTIINGNNGLLSADIEPCY